MVTMRLNKDAVVKTDSSATVQFAGLLGQNFVTIGFGSPAAQPATAATHLKGEDQPDLNAILKKLENAASGVERLTGSFTGDTIDNVLGPLRDILKANRAPITATISNLQSISTQIADGTGTVGKLF